MDFNIIEKIRFLNIDPIQASKLIQNNKHNSISAMYNNKDIIYI